MKTKKIDLSDFKQNELSRENISSIKAGEPITGKPTVGSRGNGSGDPGDDGVTCYYTFDGELLYCQREDGTIIESTT